MENQSLTIQLQVSDPANSDYLAVTTAALIDELLTVEYVQSANQDESKSEAPPPNSKSGESAIPGMIAVALVTVGIPELIRFIQAWCMRNEGKTVTIEKDGKKVTFPVKIAPEELEWVKYVQERLVD